MQPTPEGSGHGGKHEDSSVGSRKLHCRRVRGVRAQLRPAPSSLSGRSAWSAECGAHAAVSVINNKMRDATIPHRRACVTSGMNLGLRFAVCQGTTGDFIAPYALMVREKPQSSKEYEENPIRKALRQQRQQLRAPRSRPTRPFAVWSFTRVGNDSTASPAHNSIKYLC